MKYTPHIGMIYDVIYYGVIYFNKSAVIKKFTECKYNLDGAFSFFDEVKNNCKPLPQCLYPFFYYDAVTPSALSEYMRINVDFHAHNMNDFFNLILNKTKFKKYVFDYLFCNLSDNDRTKLIERDSEIVINVFKSQAWPSIMVEQTTLLLYNFSYISDLLYEYLKEIYEHIKKLHDKYAAIIGERIKETTKRETLLLFEKLYSLNADNVHKQFFSLCFIHQYVRFDKKDSCAESVFILGMRFKETLITDCDNKSILINKMLFLLGDPIRFNVIQLFSQHGYLTLSDISRLANISTSTAFNIVSIFLEGRIIKESHREGRKVYFYLNAELFISSIKSYTDFIQSINFIKENNYENQ